MIVHLLADAIEERWCHVLGSIKVIIPPQLIDVLTHSAHQKKSGRKMREFAIRKLEAITENAIDVTLRTKHHRN